MSEDVNPKETLLSKSKDEIWAMYLPELSSYVRDLRSLYRQQKAERERNGMKRCHKLLWMSAKRLDKITD